MEKHSFISSGEINKLIKHIDEQLVMFIKDGKYKEVLLTLGNISKYSFTNQLYIFSQMKEARTLKGIREWNKLNRTIKKGEKAIKIISPIKKYLISDDEDDEKVQKVIGYKFSYLFDISQTEGEKINNFEIDKTINVNKKDEIIKKLSTFINKKGYEIKYVSKEILGKGCFGQCRYKEKMIYLLENMSNLEEISVLIHESAHALAHCPYKEGFEGLISLPTRDIREVEAESISCIVCSYLGLDTNDYSFSYILSWASGDIKKFRNNIEVISKYAKEIINCLSDCI